MFFIWNGNRAEAQSGYNDDLTMAFGIGVFLRDTALHFQQQGVDMARATLGGIHSTNHLAPNIYSGNNNANKNPYEILRYPSVFADRAGDVVDHHFGLFPTSSLSQ